MSKKQKKEIDFSKVAARVIKSPLENFVEDSYLPYAHYVIMSRALISDDGLKPVQRRILYAMDQLGLTDKKDFIKAAQIVGETMGKYHPHGDSSIGDALSRMGQDFSLRVPLVDVQGSVGFNTGDDPAAPRYWEGRPTAAAMELSKDLKEGAIEMGLNYDGKFAEPSMLPVKWPNGLINGSQGIAVGYSSTIVPHNPTEVMRAAIELVKNPELSIGKIMKIMPGPDMPTGGVLLGYEGVKEYYETGRGTFSIRGRYEILPGLRGTHEILFTEAPYQVSGEQIIAAIDKNKKEKDRFKEISYAKDLSDMDNGFTLSIKVKAGANPEVVLKDLFKFTPLETSFSVNMNVLKDGVPKICSVKEMLESFIYFRKECIINKTTNKITNLNANIERLEGIVKVLVDIDKAISIIRKAEDNVEASQKLQSHFKINEEQSNYILSMPLRRLTKSDSVSIKNEMTQLIEDRDFQEKILNDEETFKEFMIDELMKTKAIIDSPRRTTISNKTEAELKAEAALLKKAAEEASKNSDCYITLFSDDTIVRTKEPYVQTKQQKGIISQVKIGTKENLVFITKDGDGLKLQASHVSEDLILEVSLTTGLPEGSVIGVGKEIVSDSEVGTLIVTNQGGVNIVNGITSSSDRFKFTKLEDDEEIVMSTWVDNVDEKVLTLVSTDGYVLKFPLEQIRTSNAGAGTVKGMNLSKDAKIAGAAVSAVESAVLVSCTHKTVKVTELSEVPIRNRNAKGVVLQRISKGDEIISAFASERVVANKGSKTLRLPETTARALIGTNRTGSGIILGHYKV